MLFGLEGKCPLKTESKPFHCAASWNREQSVIRTSLELQNEGGNISFSHRAWKLVERTTLST